MAAAQTNLRVQLDSFNIQSPAASVSVASAPIPEPAEVCRRRLLPASVDVCSSVNSHSCCER